MKRYLLFICIILFLWFPVKDVQAQTSQTVFNGSATSIINFPGASCAYSWVNNNPGIGLPASGVGNIASFNGINAGTIPITATITAIPAPAQLAYMANGASNTVSVINTTTNAVVADIPVGANPGGVAVSPDGKLVYVANSQSSNVSVISTLTNTVIYTIGVGNLPNSVAVSPDGKILYVANSNINTIANTADGSISIIDATTYALITNVDIGNVIQSIAISPDGARLYVTESDGIRGNSYNSHVVVVNTASNTVSTSILLGMNNSPSDMAISPDGNYLYLTIPVSNTIEIISTSTGTVLSSIPLGIGTNPVGITVSINGKYLYVSNTQSNTVSIINTVNNAVSSVKVGINPFGISASPDGNWVYVANTYSNNVSIISTASNTVVATVPVDSDPASFGNFISAGPGCSGLPVTFTITVLPNPVITATGTLSSLSTTYGTASPATGFTVTGQNMTDGILVTPPIGFEVSTDNINFSPTVIVGTAGTIAATSVFVRLASTTLAGSYSGDIVLTSANAKSVNVPTVLSTVTIIPSDITTGTVTGIIVACAGTASASPNIKQIPVSANNLSADLIVTAPADFEVSLTEGSGYSNNVTLAQSGGIVNNVIIYVRSAASAPPGNISGNILLTSAGIKSQSVLVNGTITPLPYITPVSSQVVFAGNTTLPINFTGTANIYSWINDNPSIGLAASGADNIEAFTAINTTNSPITATITATPLISSLAYIANSNANTVSVINTATSTVLSAIPVGRFPYGVSLSPDKSKVYVTNNSSNTISVINTTTNTIVETIPTDGNPNGVLASPNGYWVYVVNSTSSTVSVINAATYAALPSIPVGINPEGIAANPTGNFIYVTNNSSSNVSVINTSTNVVVFNIAVGANPSGIAVNPDGNTIYVANTGSASVSVIDAATNLVKYTIQVGSSPTSVSVSPDGNFLYVTNTSSNTVSVINTKTNLVISTISVGSNPLGVSVSPDGSQVYVVNNISNSISVINTKTNTLTGTINVGDAPVSIGNFITGGSGCNGNSISFTITVNPAMPVITASGILAPVSTIYGTASPSAGFNVSGANMQAAILLTPPPGFEISTNNAVFNNQATMGATGIIAATPVYIRLAATTPAGSYTGNIVLSSAGAVNVYEAINGMVNQAPLTITATNQSKTYGEDNPVLTAIYSGFVNNDGPNQLIAQPSITTTADKASPVGKYPITVSGALSPNYIITYVAGTLTINPPTPAIVIPNAFTPNGDGINDTWDIKHLDDYPNCTVTVFNRYGQKVFFSNNYPVAWNGCYKGADLPVGTYYYIINLNRELTPLSGPVTIIR